MVGRGRPDQDGGEYATVPFHGLLFSDAPFEAEGGGLRRDRSDWRLPQSLSEEANIIMMRYCHSFSVLEWR